jgi:alpha-beta hydrolase superfamily lysophospholipase
MLAATACSSRGRDAAPETAVTLRPDAGSWSLPGTLRIPEAAGGIPCVVFFAGSGPTDRDWLSPLLPGTNGSGRQLAEGLAAKGIGSLRFDKVGSGKNMEHLEVLSLEHYVEEAALAFDFLAARPECARVFLLGHSEGAFHATGAALARQSSPSFGGLVLLAGASGTMLDTATAQIRQIHERAGDDMTSVDAGLASFRRAVTTLPDVTAPDLGRVPEAAALWRAATDPRQGKVVRELLLADPLEPARAYRGPALVLAAGRDAQVTTADADTLLAALGSTPESKRRIVIANANHVFKGETRDPAALTPAQVATTYTEEGRPLADGVVDAISAFVVANRK